MANQESSERSAAVARATAGEAVELAENPWDNTYWFARMLINSDKYGAVGGDRRTMLGLVSAIRGTLQHPEDGDTEPVATRAISSVETVLLARWSGSRKEPAVRALVGDLADMILTPKDVEVFALTCERVLVPIGDALARIPNSDQAFAETMARALLASGGEAALATLVNIWDDVGSHGCMAAERAEVVREFTSLRRYLSQLQLSSSEQDTVLTAFCQEFERRLGQKRKGRAGRGVENVTALILDHFGITATSTGPEHFTTGLEVDRWVKTKDRWFIGVSCKRTLRERWKQAYTTDLDLLNRHKIKAIWHVLTFDRDLSDDKITEIGSHHAILYLPDDSPRYASARTHPGMSSYVRPLSSFIGDLKAETS